MSYYCGKIEVQTIDTSTISFEYEFDNEICPEIFIPDNWKALCGEKNQISRLFDGFLCESGLRELIEEFDECLPEDYQSGSEFDDFLQQIENNSGRLQKIVISVIDEDDSTIYSQKVLEL